MSGKSLRLVLLIARGWAILRKSRSRCWSVLSVPAATLGMLCFTLSPAVARQSIPHKGFTVSSLRSISLQLPQTSSKRGYSTPMVKVSRKHTKGGENLLPSLFQQAVSSFQYVLVYLAAQGSHRTLRGCARHTVILHHKYGCCRLHDDRWGAGTIYP